MPQSFYAQSATPAAIVIDFAAARLNMVEGQLRPNQVGDLRILDAMGEIPRELFVPSNLVGVAYLDEDIPLIGSRTLMQPMVLAKLIQAADIQEGETVLDLAPATGYSTLVLAALTDKVTAVEPDALLHQEVEKHIATYAAGRAVAYAGAPVEGCIGRAPFDVIFINGSAEFVPQVLFDQLAEGGRLIAVRVSYDKPHAAHIGQACLYRKTKGGVSEQLLFDANIRPAPGFYLPRGFTF